MPGSEFLLVAAGGAQGPWVQQWRTNVSAAGYAWSEEVRVSPEHQRQQSALARQTERPPVDETGVGFDRPSAAEAGVDQFLDLGSGIPRAGNVHEVAHAVAPHSRVVYVDVDPVAVWHARQLLQGDERTRVIGQDLRSVDVVLQEASGLLDLSRPAGLLAVSVLLFLADEERPGDVLAGCVSRLAAGSCVVFSHPTAELAAPALRGSIAEVTALYRQAGQPVVARDRATLESWLTGLEMVEPGLVVLADWRPEPGEASRSDADLLSYGVVARKP